MKIQNPFTKKKRRLEEEERVRTVMENERRHWEISHAEGTRAFEDLEHHQFKFQGRKLDTHTAYRDTYVFMCLTCGVKRELSVRDFWSGAAGAKILRDWSQDNAEVYRREAKLSQSIIRKRIVVTEKDTYKPHFELLADGRLVDNRAAILWEYRQQRSNRG